MHYRAQNYSYKRKKKKNKLLIQTLLLLFMLIGVGFLSYSVTDLFYTKKEVGDTGISNVELAYSAGGQVQGIALDLAMCKRFEEVGRDAFHSVYIDRKWYLFTDNPDDSTMTLTVEPSEDFVKFYEAYRSDINVQVQYMVVGTEDLAEIPLIEPTKEKFELGVSLLKYNPGVYETKVIIQSDCGKFESQAYKYNLSYPVYVNLTLDWEGYTVKDETFNALDSISEKYNAPITHFWNPRIYATNDYSQSYKDRATKWVKERESKGDEIGMHMHMFFDMVGKSGVTVQKAPAWGWNTNDGYDVLVYGYSQQDLGRIIDWAKGEFEDNGLPEPKVFRAGGWQADEGTLVVLQAKGFYGDSSGRTKFTLGSNGVAIPWDLKVESQPYRPNRYDQNLGTGSPADILKIWEFPNNGGDCTALSSYEILGRFGQIYNGRPVDELKVFNFLSHPDYFNKDQECLYGVMEGISKHSYEKDEGAVIFETIGKVHKLVSK